MSETTPDPRVVSEAFRQDCKAKGFPWCDTCKEPAVWREFTGMLHSTDAHPFGLPPHMDSSGHKVTMREWDESLRDW
jgi:hypothetical protein